MNNGRQWRFDAAQFRVLWDATGRDVLPYPLAHRFTDEATQEDVDRTRQRIAQTVVPQVSEDLEHAVALLLDPHARVEVAGYRGHQRRQRIRVHAGVREDHGALLVQEPGPDDTVGGNVHLSLLPAGRIAAAVVDVLPETAEGQRKPLHISIEELNDEPEAWMRDPWVIGPSEQLKRFMDRPVSASFHVAAYPWGSPDNRHTQGRKDFQIFDFVDDGRYAGLGDRVLRIKPTNSTRMTAQVRDMISHTLTQVRNGDYLRP